MDATIWLTALCAASLLAGWVVGYWQGRADGIAEGRASRLDEELAAAREMWERDRAVTSRLRLVPPRCELFDYEAHRSAR